ncbi:MAG TPA: EAL domain-containing protein, partial [Thermoanaerobaculia bacterium]|nr:EAL domain-containing protein [Thermoanaerobaculia bacterium]
MFDRDAQLASMLLDQTGSLVWSTNGQLQVTGVRGATPRHAGMDIEEMVSRTAAAHRRVLRGEAIDFDYEVSERVYEVHLAPVRTVGGMIAGCIGMARDVTVYRRAERTMVWQSSHDALTRLPNRTYLREKLTQSIRDARRGSVPLALLLVDIDAMHCVNDAAGQEAGDALLVAVAARIVAAAPGSFVARIDGDAFAVLAEGSPLLLAETIGEAIATVPFAAGPAEVPVTASIGVAEFPHHGDTAPHLLRAAEAALRRAVDLGGQRHQLASADLTIAAAERLGIETRLRRAIERGELSLAFQPQVHLPDGGLLGLEALLRWHRDGELVPAASFIRAVEESAIIIDIGEWVIDEACRQLRAWRDAGIAPPRLALNIGARHFQHPGFLETVRHAIERHGIDSHMLEIEITETTAMHNAETTAHLIDDLRDLGVEITIDDFGTGYSSLAYLKRFAITAVKIDRSFVHDLPSSRSAGAIVNAILATAHALGLRVVAEG